MSRRTREPLRVGAALSLILCLLSCKEDVPKEPEPVLTPIIQAGILIPVPTGWVSDESVNSKHGVVFRLVRESSVPGSPRIEVVVDPRQETAPVLEDLLSRSLRDMAEFEEQGKIKITRIDRREVRVGPRRAYRVAHDYTMGSDDSTVALSQISKLLLLDGRGVTVTAAGRTELFHPLSDDIDTILGGIQVMLPSQIEKLRAEAAKSPGERATGELKEKAQQLVEPMPLDDNPDEARTTD